MNLFKKITQTFFVTVVAVIALFIAGCETAPQTLKTPTIRTTASEDGFFVFSSEVTNAEYFYVKIYDEDENLLNTFKVTTDEIVSGYKVLKPEGKYFVSCYVTDSDGIYQDSNQSVMTEVVVEKQEVVLNTYTITYHLDGGILPENAKTEYKEKEKYNLPVPTKENHTFLGWYNNADLTGEKVTTTSNGNLEVYAAWEKHAIVASYTISYVLNGGTLSSSAPSKYVEGETVTLINPTKSNATFEGWYKTADFSGERVTVIANTSKENITLYAKWLESNPEYTGYYKNANGLTGNALKIALRTIISTGVKNTTYDSLRQSLQYTDADPNDSSKIMLIYSNTSMAGAWQSGDTWNREHVWPQSLGWFKTSGAGSDIHHIRPEDNRVNSARGNKPFGEVNGGKTVTYNGKVVGYYDSRFEPLDEVKGDVARIILYMLTRYSNTDSGYTVTTIITSMDLLLKWHEADPVSDFERVRNQRCYEKQNNYNPFIDHPEFARMIWG